MNAWLLHIGEDLPIDGGGRTFRYGYLAEAILRRGGSVLRWAPTLRHTDKTQRAPHDQRLTIEPGYEVQLVHARGYRTHVGLRRLRMYRSLRASFERLAPRVPRPDVIVAAIPSLEWADAAVRYGEAYGVPVVIDVRDLWPDVFERATPEAFRPAARWALAGYRRLARRACRGANALTAVAPSYLAWAQRHAGRPAGPNDFVAPIGCAAWEPPEGDVDRLTTKLLAEGFDPSAPTACYAGQFARSSDLATVLDAHRSLRNAGRPLQLLLCGDGAQGAALRRRAAGQPGVHFLGWVDASTIGAAMRRSQIGLCAYAAGATQSWPNKPFEYFAGRLAVVSSLPGDLERLLNDHNAGLTYRAGDSHDLARRLDALLAAPERLTAMRDDAHRLWRERFRPEPAYGRFVDRLESLVARPAVAA